MSYCVNCGKELGEKDRFCPNCGAAISSGVPVQASAPRQGRKRRFRRWMLIPLAVLLVGGLVTAAVLILNPPKQVIELEDPKFQLDMELILDCLCTQSDKVDGTNYADADSSYYSLSQIIPLLQTYADQGQSQKQKDFVKSLLDVCAPLSKVTSSSGNKVSLKNLGLNIEKFLSLYQSYFGSLPEGIHYSPISDSSKASSSKSSSSKSSFPSSSSKSSLPSAAQTIADSRWDGDPPSGKTSDGLEQVNGYSIVFKNGKAYFGSTYDTTSDIVSGGTQMTYVVSSSTIVFTNSKTKQTATCRYSTSAITDTNGTMTATAGYVFYPVE